ncbi:MAG: insulinase family protein [Clostridia bacterium]|nr:insulinase family protein [Clostridia bacterium]MBP3360220.1 insulinase family protein [Clostridia bacterium]
MERIYDKLTGESVYYKKHESGLNIYIMPRAGYNSSYAIFGTKYGSVDSEFIVPGEAEATKVPDGIAHYLEHKMFDQPDGSNVFDRFSKFGGEANAFTSFNMTAYLFSATRHFYENLETLLDYVQSPYFTKESVEKEQGIIGQEIRMYDDNAPWRLFFNFLGLLYNNNPVKLDIAGTVESIAEIDEKLLYKCYNTFYNLSNMTLFVTGDLNVEKTLRIIERNIKNNEPFTEEIKRIYPEEPKQVAGKYKEQRISVATPMFMMGWKDNDVGYSGKPLLKKSIEMEILVEMLFGKSSKLYNELYDEGLINQNFSFEYSPQIDYGYTAIDGESKNPEAVYEKITKYVDGLRESGLCEDDFKRIKKIIWGDFIRSYNDIEGYAHSFLSMSFLDISYFDYFDEYKKITFEDVKKRFLQQFDNEYCVLSVIKPE